MRILSFLACLMLMTGAQAASCKPAECQQIKSTVLDYAEGWYTGNGERMKRALYDELVKRTVNQNQVSTMGKEYLVSMTASGYGKTTEAATMRKQIEILDVQNNIALVKLRMQGWVDYMQLGKIDDRWQIVNVMWGE